MAPKVDLTGLSFGRLLVINETNKRSSSGCVRWECICECGNEIVRDSDYLQRKKTPSCGCAKFKHKIIIESGKKKKWCRKCKQTKETSKFHRNKDRVSGYSYRCIKCAKEAHKLYIRGRGGERKRQYARMRILRETPDVKNKRRAKARRHAREQIKDLSDTYVKHLLFRNDLKKGDFSEVNIDLLIEVKRLQITLKRGVKNESNGHQ